MLLDPNLAKAVIDAGLNSGASFVDVFVENNALLNVSYLDSKVKNIASGTDFGIGIRLVFGTNVQYGYSSQTGRDELLKMVQTLAALGPEPGAKKVLAAAFEPNHSFRQPARFGLDQGRPLSEKIEPLAQLNRLVRKEAAIAQVDIGLLQRCQQVEIFNSEGLVTNDTRHYIRLAATAIARDGQQQARAFEGPGMTMGFEFIDGMDMEEFAATLSQRAITNLHAKPCPAGTMAVVIDNGFGGVIFHEACGHLLETTSVEKKASVFHDKMGEMIAHPSVSATDDGTIGGEWGSINIDDEGMPVQRTQLIKDGKLVGFLVDRVGHMKTGYPRSGSGRRQSYKFAPASRMRNTFIEPGPHSLTDLIASIDYGLYAKSMGGGSVTPGTGQFNFAVEEGYLIRNGQIAEPVKGATMIGSGPEVLKKISMVSNNFALRAGMCGSVSGSIPVTVGQAAIKVDSILVGGVAE